MTTTNLSALVRYSLRFPQAHWCSNNKTEYLVSTNKISPRISPLNKKRKNQQTGLKTSYTVCDFNTEDTTQALRPSGWSRSKTHKKEDTKQSSTKSISKFIWYLLQISGLH